ncbi:MAG: Gfo/Idh/MocA family oxidoreductase [Cytophagaceae bacterium]
MNPITTAVIGIGRSAQVFHIPFIQNLPHFNWVAGVERHGSTLQEKFPDVQCYRSAEDLWKREDIELVIITTPNQSHAFLVEQALLAGKHVLVDKPFVVNYEDALRLQQLAKEKQRTIFVFQNRRWDSDWLTIQSLVKSHRLGDVSKIISRMDRYRPEPRLTYWKESDMMGNGLWYDLGAHMLDQAFQGFGLPIVITASLKKQRIEAQGVDFFEVVLKYRTPKPFEVVLSAGMLQEEPSFRWEVIGSKGTFQKKSWDKQENALANGVYQDVSISQDVPEEYGVIHYQEGGVELVPTITGKYEDFYTSVYETIRENKKFPVSLEDVNQVIYWLEKIQSSAVHGTVTFAL